MGTKFSKDWAEWIAIFLLLVGFTVAIIIDTPLMHLIIIFLAGLMAGKLWYKERKQVRFPFFIILLGLMIGYTAGIMVRKGNVFLVVLIFLIGMVINYLVYKKGILG